MWELPHIALNVPAGLEEPDVLNHIFTQWSNFGKAIIEPIISLQDLDTIYEFICVWALYVYHHHTRVTDKSTQLPGEYFIKSKFPGFNINASLYIAPAPLSPAG